MYMESQFDANVHDHHYLLPLQPAGANDSHRSQRSQRSQRSLATFYEKDLHLSSLPQSIFNCTNSLMGVGLLSLPYTMRVCGWLGVGVLLLFAAITHHTGKLLGRIMDYTPKHKLRDGPGAYTMYGFHDMGYAAFGQVGRPPRPPPLAPAPALIRPPPLPPRAVGAAVHQRALPPRDLRLLLRPAHHRGREPPPPPRRLPGPRRRRPRRRGPRGGACVAVRVVGGVCRV